MRRSTLLGADVVHDGMLCAGDTGTCSTRSTGRTLRHHPTPPTRARTIPTTLTATWVTSPANPSVTPSATTIGHTVGAGSAMRSGSLDWVMACPTPAPREATIDTS